MPPSRLAPPGPVARPRFRGEGTAAASPRAASVSERRQLRSAVVSLYVLFGRQLKPAALSAILGRRGGTASGALGREQLPEEPFALAGRAGAHPPRAGAPGLAARCPAGRGREGPGWQRGAPRRAAGDRGWQRGAPQGAAGVGSAVPLRERPGLAARCRARPLPPSLPGVSALSAVLKPAAAMFLPCAGPGCPRRSRALQRAGHGSAHPRPVCQTPHRAGVGC
ncbi:POLG alternative reading frame-like [Melospiza georgiana]|uniref:POLG alternative reading frame-like n=1 Tax=Melospiza georgiana TaxID=44398 RepID=UPI0025AD0393|nr:POLG alternative reading frame-like [Melospiza georgiana]